MSMDLIENLLSYNGSDGSLMQPGLFRKPSERALTMPEWEAIVTGIALTIIIILTVIGNILVALSVFTSRHLRLVQNYYIVSLAVADMTVAIFVLPFSVVYIIQGRWIFGIHICKMWLTMDIMCCTSSILNLCVIALDRYWSIATPIRHARKRSKKHVLRSIMGIWVLSFLISSPPLIGWNNWPFKFDKNTPCELTNDLGYVIYSAMGSFYIPLFIMTIVYFKIYTVMRKRLHQRAFIDTVYPLSMSQSIVEPPGGVQSTSNGLTAQSKFMQPIVLRFSYLKQFLSPNVPSTISTLPRSHKREIHGDADPNVFDILAEKKNTDNIGSQVDEVNVSSSHAKINELKTLSRARNDDDSNGKSIEFRSLTNAAQFRQQKQKVIQKRERRAARTLSVIMGVFVICWLPFFVMYITGPFCGSLCPSSKIRNFFTWLGYINSSLNPIIYTIFNVDYRKAFKRLLGFSDV